MTRFIVGQPKEARWRWIDVPGFVGMRLHVYIPTTAEWSRVARQFHIGDDKRMNTEGFRKFVCEKWFDDVKGIYTAEGETAENSLDARLEITNELTVWAELQEALSDGAALREEGNADGGAG